MNTAEINEQLFAVGEKIKAKGWGTVGIRIWIEYLAPLDLPHDDLDPMRMLSYRPSISATPHRPDGSFYGSGGSNEYVKDGWGVKSLEDAVAKLHEAADAMPKMFDEAARIDAIKNKLTESERQLLGVL